jgi:hypothetical protein
MAKLGRSMTIRFLVFGVLVLAATSWAQTRPPIAEQIAKTYGLDSFGQIEAIRYTFNAQFPGVDVSHSWVWQPKIDQISYEGKDKDGKPVKATYVETQLNGESSMVKEEIEPAFVNDNYWLLFPFHVYWDSSADVDGHAKIAAGERFGEASGGEVSFGGRLLAWRYLGALRRV